jgi:redox-sensitive bicupin YhaK (pirin superfamily)
MSTNAIHAIQERETIQARRVERVIQPQWVMEGAGVRLRRSIATNTLDYLDPFLLFDHFGSDNPFDYLRGFPLHPHRGIETVTYMLDGVVVHEDSIGNAGSITAGDVQWMTAGGGVMHEEMPKPHDGKMEGFQLWVNLPARLKMTRPRYQEIPSSTIPEVKVKNGVKIRVITGRLNGVTGPVTDIAADPTYLDITVPPDTALTQPVARGHAAFAYAFRGNGLLGLNDDGEGTRVVAPLLAVLSDGEHLHVRAGQQGLRFLLVSGKPLGERIARHGPLVMNTPEEIRQALEDLRNGTFAWRAPD